MNDFLPVIKVESVFFSTKELLSGFPKNGWHRVARFFSLGAVSSIENGVETASTSRTCCTVLCNDVRAERKELDQLAPVPSH